METAQDVKPLGERGRGRRDGRRKTERGKRGERVRIVERKRGGVKKYQDEGKEAGEVKLS